MRLVNQTHHLFRLHLEVRGQAVAAQQNDVEVAQLDAINHNVDAGRRAERLQDDVLVGVALGLFFSDVTCFD